MIRSVNISDSPLCSCGSVENAQHFFLRCPRYNEHRALLFNEVSKHQLVSLNLLLYGISSLPHKTNVSIISTYQTLRVLLREPSQLFIASGHNKSEGVVHDGIHYCNLPIAYRPGLVSVFTSPHSSQHFHILFFINYQSLVNKYA